MSHSRTWAIDFDGVIHDRANPLPGKRMGGPIEGARDALVTLKEHDCFIIIHSTMALSPTGRKAIEDWMSYYDIPYDVIREKPAADVYLDDKGERFEGWGNVDLPA